jgi:predicted  nucleic acid-binding Zn-ribbon protein
MGSAFTEKVKELDAQIKEEIKKVQTSTKAIVNKMNVAKKMQDKKLEADLKKEMEVLNEKSEALVDEFESFKEEEPKRIQNEFQLAMGAISVEAANTFEDYMEAFAVLMKKALQGHLNGKLFSSCFDTQTKVVEVKVEKLLDKKEKETVLKACPTS